MTFDLSQELLHQFEDKRGGSRFRDGEGGFQQLSLRILNPVLFNDQPPRVQDNHFDSWCEIAWGYSLRKLIYPLTTRPICLDLQAACPKLMAVRISLACGKICRIVTPGMLMQVYA